MVPAFLLSLLKAQLQAAGAKDKFTERYPHHWLIWEPGTWTAPAAAHETVVQLDSRNPLAVGRGDALSFALKPNPSRPGALTVGRSASNDIVINDATVSRQHAVLRAQSNGFWSIEISAGVKALSRMGERDLPPGLPTPLRNGNQLRLGDVRLTYHDLAGIVQRLSS